MSMNDDMNRVVICKFCNVPEYWGQMRWLNGKCLCRNCYKAAYQDTYGEPYKWNDLNGPRPSIADNPARDSE